MLKILNTSQIREWDNFTIKGEPIASIDLMERACKAFTLWFTKRFNAAKRVGVVCGTGNNGGDGLAIARLLSDFGFNVSVWTINSETTPSADFTTNKKRVADKLVCKEIDKITDGLFNGCDILIDGIFGSGLSREVDGIYKQVIEEINNTKARVVAIDIPSGLFADKHTSGLSVRSDHTITFQSPKLCFFFPENSDKVGEWHVVDIGLSTSYLKDVSTDCYLVEKKWVIKRIPKRKKFSHKGDFGKALLVAGSFGKMGAAVLAARAAMKSGVGLLTVHVPQVGYQIIQSTVPEAMASVDEGNKYFTAAPDFENFNGLGIGPGIGQEKNTVIGLKSLLERVKIPVIIDADGLNILAANSELLHLIPQNSILTPHPGEFQRLVGDWDNDFHRLEKAKTFAAAYKCILILKGANTSVISPNGKVFFNSTGNPGMATAGSGDVLTGILTSLLAQKMQPLEAAISGVFIHGFAGDLAALEIGQIGLTASDIINALPVAFRSLIR